MRKTIALLALALLVSAFSASAAKADIMLFDIDADPGAWATAIAGLAVSTGYNFDLDADYDIVGFDSPLTSAGGGPVSPGILPDDMSMACLDPCTPVGGVNGLAAIGPSSGFGNPSNAIVANFFVDAFTVINLLSPKAAFEFNALNFLSENGEVDITVNDDQGGATVFTDIFVNFDLGKNLGILGTSGMDIVSVEIFDTVPGNNGAEGVQGAGLTYVSAVPEPSTLLLLGFGLAGLGFFRRRRIAA